MVLNFPSDEWIKELSSLLNQSDPSFLPLGIGRGTLSRMKTSRNSHPFRVQFLTIQ
jgi:hypothetical protein